MAGTPFDCPNCHHRFALQALPTTSARHPARKKTAGGPGLALPVCILGALALLYANHHYGESPVALWQRLSTLIATPPHAAEAQAPPAEDAPATTPPSTQATETQTDESPGPAEASPPAQASEPTEFATSETETAGAEPGKPATVETAETLASWMAANPQALPKQATLREDVKFGSGKPDDDLVVAPSGVQVRLIGIEADSVLVAYGHANFRARIPIAATDLLESAEKARNAYLSRQGASPRLPAAPGSAPRYAQHVRAKFVHPGVPFTREDLETLKARLGEEPWKSGFASLANDSHSSLNYSMQGPCEEVKRAPNQNITQWRNDMNAVYNLALMWWFTGDARYAQKSRDILIAWAQTQKSFGGGEAGLDLGDYVHCYAGGADILRGTWKGWSKTDTELVKKLFLDVYWPSTGVDHNTVGPANKGTLVMATGAGIAAFCDDQKKIDHIVSLVRTSASSGLLNILPTGQIGETGRDGGHSYGQWASLAFAAEILWKQGIDVYSEMEDRLLAAGEYYARTNLGLNAPYIPFGTIDYLYWKSNPYLGWAAPRRGMSILHGAYVVRKGLSSPYLEREKNALPINGDGWMYEKTADTSKATPLVPVNFPKTAAISSGFEDIDIGGAKAQGKAGYRDGIWTITGAGNEIWTSGTDSCHFTYKKITGDCAIIAKVESVQTMPTKAKAGVMIRSDLTPNAAKRAWMGVKPDHKMEFYQHGWTPGGVWGGSNWDKGDRDIPDHYPYWLKLERLGNIVSLYLSVDGTSWAAAGAAEYADMPETAYIGLMACSMDNATSLTATFSNVCITGGNGTAPLSAPQAPLCLNASPGSGQVPLRWTGAGGATSYKIKRATASGGPYTTIATIPGNTYTDTAVANDTTYHYVVSAANAVGESPDSPEDAVTPTAKMVNVATSGTASAYAESSNAKNAFDRNSGTKWYAGENAGVGAIQYDFGSGRHPVVKRYSITSANDVPGRDPKDWQFQGSKDGVNWTTLDTQSGQSFPYRHYDQVYPISKPGDYRYYRLNVTADNGANSIQIGELSLLSDKAP